MEGIIDKDSDPSKEDALFFNHFHIKPEWTSVEIKNFYGNLYNKIKTLFKHMEGPSMNLLMTDLNEDKSKEGVILGKVVQDSRMFEQGDRQLKVDSVLSLDVNLIFKNPDRSKDEARKENLRATIIHESSHKYLQTADHEYLHEMSKSLGSRMNMDYILLNPDKTIENADSFAYYCLGIDPFEAKHFSCR